MTIPTAPIARPTYPAHDVKAPNYATMIGDIVRVILTDGETMIATLTERRQGGYRFTRVAGLSAVSELFLPFGAITSLRRAY